MNRLLPLFWKVFYVHFKSGFIKRSRSVGDSNCYHLVVVDVIDGPEVDVHVDDGARLAI